MAAPELSGDPLLDHHLLPLWGFVTRRDIMEVMVTNFGEVQLEIVGRDRFIIEKAPKLDKSYWYTLARVLSQLEEQTFDEETAPFVSTKLPGGHRLELLLGRWVESGISVSIRIFRNLKVPLEDYAPDPGIQTEIRDSIRQRFNVFLSGGTSSGKTTLANNILVNVPSTERVLTIEDVRELQLPHVTNKNHFLVDRWGRGVTYDRMFDHFMRSRPDRILSGELSTRNVQATAMLLSTGHKGLLTTLHSNGCQEALQTAFHDRMVLSGINISRDHLTDYLRRNVDLVMHVAKTPEGRRITEIWRPADEAEPRKLYQ